MIRPPSAIFAKGAMETLFGLKDNEVSDGHITEAVLELASLWLSIQDETVMRQFIADLPERIEAVRRQRQERKQRGGHHGQADSQDQGW